MKLNQIIFTLDEELDFNFMQKNYYIESTPININDDVTSVNILEGYWASEL